MSRTLRILKWCAETMLLGLGFGFLWLTALSIVMLPITAACAALHMSAALPVLSSIGFTFAAGLAVRMLSVPFPALIFWKRQKSC